MQRLVARVELVLLSSFVVSDVAICTRNLQLLGIPGKCERALPVPDRPLCANNSKAG